MQRKAQGTIEYLVILAVIVVVGLVVVSVIINSTAPAKGVSNTTSQIATASNPIAVTETIVSEDGNYFLKINNNTGENVTVTRIEVGENTTNTLNKRISPNAKEAFILSTNDVCVDGQLASQEVVIIYENQYDLEKRQVYPVPITFDCGNYEATVTYTDQENITHAQDGGTSGGPTCDENWTCTLWTPTDCPILEEQTRVCTDTNSCGIEINKPVETQSCTYIPPIITLSSTETGTYKANETLVANITGFDDTNTYHYSWYQNDTLNATTIIETNLIAYWPLDNDSKDYHNNYDLVNVGATPGTGRVGKSYEFNRSETDRMTTADSVTSDKFTLSLWVKETTRIANGNCALAAPIYRGQGPMIMSNNGKVCLSAGSRSGCGWVTYSNVEIPLNEWTHLAITGQTSSPGGNVKVYLNGEYTGNTLTSCMSNNPGSFNLLPTWFAHQQTYGYFDGYIDEVLIYDEIIPDEQIRQLYYGGKRDGNQMDPNRTAEGENWKVGFRTNDGSGWTNEEQSAEVTITDFNLTETFDSMDNWTCGNGDCAVVGGELVLGPTDWSGAEFNISLPQDYNITFKYKLTGLNEDRLYVFHRYPDDVTTDTRYASQTGMNYTDFALFKTNTQLTSNNSFNLQKDTYYYQRNEIKGRTVTVYHSTDRSNWTQAVTYTDSVDVVGDKLYLRVTDCYSANDKAYIDELTITT